MAILSTGSAPMPTPVKRQSAKRDPSPFVVELTEALNRLPADGATYVDVEGKTAKGAALVAGKVAAANGFAIRTHDVSPTVVRLWKIALTTEQIADRDAKKAAAKAAKAAKQAANLAELKGE